MPGGDGFWQPLPGSGSSGGGGELLHARDERASGSSGGSSTAGAWTTRTINTVKTNEITGASLASDLITLPAGTYEADITGAFYSANRCKHRLWNATAAATLLSGRSDYGGGGVGQSARIVGRFTLASTSDVRLDYYVEAGTGTIGLGVPSSSGEVEVYADLLIRKVG